MTIRFCVFVFLVFLFKGILYRACVQYQLLKQRALIEIVTPDIQQNLNSWLQKHPSATVEQIVDFAQAYSTNDVHYTFGKCSTNPNPNDILTKRTKTNCVGYSATLHAVATYLLAKKGLSAQVKSEHRVGKLYLLGCNLHQFFSDAAFQDHDYNVITDKYRHQKYVLDPTVYAIFGIQRVTE